MEDQFKELLQTLHRVLDELNPVQRDVWLTYSLSRDTVNAGELGVKLGNEHKNGDPIPAGTIRGTKRRVMTIVRDKLRDRGYDLDAMERRR